MMENLNAALHHLDEYTKYAGPLGTYPDQSFAVAVLKKELQIVRDSLEDRVENDNYESNPQKVNEILERGNVANSKD